jgi:hypothetical protein
MWFNSCNSEERKWDWIKLIGFMIAVTNNGWFNSLFVMGEMVIYWPYIEGMVVSLIFHW